jgi:outer membrane immunogenic protein
MRLIQLQLFGLFALLGASATQADEVTHNWNGFYAGVSAGGVSADAVASDLVVNSKSANVIALVNGNFFGQPLGGSFGEAAFIGGGQLGFNFRFGNLILGAEGDISLARIDANGAFTSVGATGNPFMTEWQEKIDWLSTLRLRSGFLARPNLLIFATGGMAFASVDSGLTYFHTSPRFTGISAVNSPNQTKVSCVPTCFSGQTSDLLTGWTVGGGFEYALTSSVSFKAEYLFVDLGSHTIKAVGVHPETTPDNTMSATISDKLNVGRVGLNFKLN